MEFDFLLLFLTKKLKIFICIKIYTQKLLTESWKPRDEYYPKVWKKIALINLKI